MAEKQGWMPKVVSEKELPLPPRPKVKFVRQLADTCPRCRCLHTSTEIAQACQSMTASREQQ